MLFGSARIQPQAHSFIVRMHYIIPQPFPSHPGHAPIHHEWQAMSGMTGYQFPHITGQEGGVAAPNLPTQMGAGPRWFDGTSWIKIIHAKGVTMTLLGQPRGGGVHKQAPTHLSHLAFYSRSNHVIGGGKAGIWVTSGRQGDPRNARFRGGGWVSLRGHPSLPLRWLALGPLYISLHLHSFLTYIGSNHLTT